MRPFPSACVILLLSAVACAERAGDGGGPAGGTMVIATPGRAVPTFPPLVLDAYQAQVADLVYDRLAEIGPELQTVGDGGFQPRLARSWEWPADSMSVAFSIDPRARWHDGRPVRANDVKFTFDLVKDPRTATQVTATIANVDSVTVRDSLTAVVWFRQRTPEQFFDVAYQVHVLPEHVLKEIPRDKLGTADISTHLIGSGPFRLARFDPGVRIELLADTANYRGRPKLDRLIWHMVGDGGAALTSLLSGQSDFYENIPAPLVPRVDSAPGVRIHPYTGLGYGYMGMNLRDPRRTGMPHPILGDRQVRRALSMALDREAMLRNVFDTLGVLGSGPFPRALADTTVRLPPFDRAQAAALLDSAGWRGGADGMRSKAGRPLRFSLIVPTSSPPRMRYAVLVQEQLRSVGARIDIESMDISTFIDRTNKRNFDAALMATGTDPGRSGLKQNWGTSAVRPGGQNAVSYSNPVFDTLLDSSLAAFDAGRANEYAHRAFQTLIDDAPAVWLYDILYIAGAHRRIQPTTMRADRWWISIPDWTIPENERIDRDRIGLRPAQP